MLGGGSDVMTFSSLVTLLPCHQNRATIRLGAVPGPDKLHSRSGHIWMAVERIEAGGVAAVTQLCFLRLGAQIGIRGNDSLDHFAADFKDAFLRLIINVRLYAFC